MIQVPQVGGLNTFLQTDTGAPAHICTLFHTYTQLQLDRLFIQGL